MDVRGVTDRNLEYVSSGSDEDGFYLIQKVKRTFLSSLIFLHYSFFFYLLCPRRYLRFFVNGLTFAMVLMFSLAFH